MPDRFVLPSESFATKLRNNPLAVAGVAALGGLLCGGVIMSALSGSPAKAPANVAKAIETSGSAPQMAAKVEPAAPAKTAPAKAAPIESSPAKPVEQVAASKEIGTTAAADCQEQTWPYIARPCLANETGQPGKRGVRVISTDKLADPVIGVVEAPPAAVTNRFERNAAAQQQLPPPPAMVAAPATPAAKPEPVVAAKVEAPKVESPKAEAAMINPVQSVGKLPVEPALSTSAMPVLQPAFAADNERAQVAPEKPKRNSRKAKKEQPVPIDDTEDVASGDREVASSDEQNTRSERRRGKRGERPRIVERWIERDYDVPSASQSGERKRVIIINRGRGNYRSVHDMYYAKHTERF